ncbi:MAG: acyl-CoA dehydrogenase family protein [Proteobacteria bacterium]|nr:acyl-CoA dehydrogenase family protein [Pseudomonadota bacterium]MDA1357144.1 acyl-CoA dehydrogenase family protein [Pseudomonadota bacterium]
MNAELELLTESAERLFTDHVTPALFRRVEAGEWPDALWRAVTAAGFERADMPEFAVAICQVAGRFAALIPLPETILAVSLLEGAGLAVPDGALTIAVADAAEPIAISANGSLSGTARRVPWARHAAHIAVISDSPEGGTLALVKLAGAHIAPGQNIACEPRDDVRFDNTPSVHAVAGVSPAVVQEQAALLRAAQIAGALERILAMTVQYAGERRQFGRPIAKFQAVQHHLAVLAGHVAAACAAVEAAVGAPDFLAVAAAKAAASEAAGEAAAIAHQLHGAIGFTEEHDLHRYTKALWAWREEFGNEAEWNSRLGAEVAARGGAALWPDVTGSGG